MQLNINNDAVVKHTNRLEKLHKSALPLAIRGTLNNAAFDVKQMTMPASAQKKFTIRQKNFFRANSKVQMAQGFNVKSMSAIVGFTDNRLRGGSNFAVKDLVQQEFGGKIRGRSFIPKDEARGNNKARPVRPSLRLGKINNIVNSNKASGKSRREKFVKSAIHVGKGGFLLGNFNKKRIYVIKSIQKRKGRTVIKSQSIYTFKKNRTVRVKGTGFMRTASIKSANKMENWYIRQAQRQIQRLK